MQYRREIDGLRAVAVIPVIFYHAGYNLFSGGFVGVDIFFVISGYLITTIILAEMGKGGFSIIKFYERRARRILPALYFVMLGCLLFAWFFLHPSDYIDFSKSLIAVSLFSSNILFWREAGYFDMAAELKPLIHTWSLAVEEQYYLFFPLFLILIWKIRKRWILASIVLIGIISLILAEWGAYNSKTANFYLLPTRAWELMIGASIAFYMIYRPNQLTTNDNTIKEFFGLFGLGLIIYSIFKFDSSVPFPSLYTLLPTIGTGLIILFSSSNTLVGKLLGYKVLVAIGLVSYSAYLWHQPILAFIKYIFIDESTKEIYTLIALFFVIFLSGLTWKYVEQPFRNKTTVKRSLLFALSAAFSLLFILFGTIGVLAAGFPSRITSLKIFSYEPDNRKLQMESWNILKEVEKKYGYERENITHPTNSNINDLLWFDITNDREPLLLIGNSHSKDLFNTFYYSQFIRKNFQIARYGLQIEDLLNNRHKFFNSPNYKATNIIIIVSRYSKADINALPKVFERLKKDNKKVYIVKNIFEFPLFGNRTIADVELYKYCKNGCETHEIGKVVQIINKAYFESFQNNKSDTSQSDFISRNQQIERYANTYNVTVLNRMDYICSQKNKECYAIDNQLNKFFYDYGHNTLAGAKFYGDRLNTLNWLDYKNVTEL